MRIRPFRPEDAPDIMHLTGRCFEESIRPFYTEEGALLFYTYILPQQLCERAANGALLLVAEEDGNVIGVAELRDGNHLSMFFVEPEFQNSGIGRKLLEKLWGLAKKLDHSIKGFTTYAAPGAVEAYRHLGFEATGAETLESGVRYTPMSTVKGVFHG